MQLFEACGEPDFEVFVWLYYVSSMMVLNLDEGKRKYEKEFLKLLEKVAKKIKLSDGATSKPQLVIARRNYS